MAKKRTDEIIVFKVKIAGKKRLQWMWRRVAPNGEIVGGSTEPYARRIQCVANAKRHFEPVVILLEAEKLEP